MKGIKTITGLIGIAIPYLDMVYQYANDLPEGMLPEPARYAVIGIGWVLAMYGRLVAQEPILK